MAARRRILGPGRAVSKNRAGRGKQREDEVTAKILKFLPKVSPTKPSVEKPAEKVEEKK